jgi:hypothetical protein
VSYAFISHWQGVSTIGRPEAEKEDDFHIIANGGRDPVEVCIYCQATQGPRSQWSKIAFYYSK